MNTDQTLVRSVALQMLQALKGAADSQNTDQLKSFGFNDQEVEEVMRLTSLSTYELDRLVDKQGSFLNITFNFDKLSRIIKNVIATQDRQQQLVDLVEADAPNQLFFDCFGYTSDMVCEMRDRVLGRGRRSTSRRELAEDEVNQLHAAKTKFENAQGAEGLASPIVSLCLALHKETSIPIRRFYREIVGS